MPKVKVLLTLFPEPREVDEDEIPSLRAQGLLVEEPVPAPVAEAATVKATKTVKDGS